MLFVSSLINYYKHRSKTQVKLNRTYFSEEILKFQGYIYPVERNLSKMIIMMVNKKRVSIYPF